MRLQKKQFINRIWAFLLLNNVKENDVHRAPILFMDDEK